MLSSTLAEVTTLWETSVMTYQSMSCEECKYYEPYHKYPNPNSVARHYCTKCNEEIRYIRESYYSDLYVVWYPKKCYFNDYFELADKYKNQDDKWYISGLACQVED